VSEPWNTWYPHYIDIWQGSAGIQILSDTAYRAVHNILQDMWKSEDCSIDAKKLRASSRVRDWEFCEQEVLDYFDRTDDGRITHLVQREKWVKAKIVYEARQNAAKKTNKTKPDNAPPSKASRSAKQSDPIAPRSADTLTVTETVTSTSAVSKTTSSHPGASLGAVQTLHPDMAIYEKYPRKEGKGAALEAIRKAVARLVKGEDPHPPMVKIEAQRYLMRRVLEYERSPVGRQEDKVKLPHPATWFNQKRYDDDQANWHRTEAFNGNRNNGKTGGNIDAAKQALAILAEAERNSGIADEVLSEAGSGGESGDLSHLRAGSIEL
jgi:hypothetical protein